ncbi:aldehyde ferredoxin oxidoreductase N-terminal domain-containing protein [Geotalea sp. SG265]|uniref:aldehyde ferredoxin oxidoreductase N-terminal domain-containing protein n=1 Tax=Geotalea sp. SG265 TaxID=2922867 RepID=UPI001FAFBFEB|nr:aldehyde ferredoxin oxidoreductase N-terminal domain-containing protein [Geotalea sp. SG265]
MRYAETGYNLEVDLTRGTVKRVQSDPRLTELHLGGQGTAAKILWERVPPETDPLTPENFLIFSAGLLHGTPVPGANRTSVSTFSPLTNLYVNSLMGGWFGPELKHAGYDKIVIGGESPGLVYLYIHNDKVEIRDASHLAGKGCQETATLLREELKDPRIQVAAIGLAGENRVFQATIEHANSSASRHGVGAVMGAKRLKAIAVRGTKDLNIASPAKLWELCRNKYQEIHDNKNCGDPMAHDHNESFHVDNFAWGNARTRRKGYWSKEREERWVAQWKEVRTRDSGCYNCPKDCHYTISYPGRHPYFLKCFNKLTYCMAAFEEIDFNYDILGLTSAYGLDGFSTPQVLAFAVELYEAGILTDKELPDFPADGAGRFFYLLEKVVRREGIGDVLANGVSRAAAEIGNGAEAFDHNTTKKVEQVPLKLGVINYPFFLMYCTGEKMNITQIEGSFPQAPIADREKRQKFVESWNAAPERFKKWFLEWEPKEHMPIEAAVNVCDWNESMHYVDDAIGTCAWLSSFRGQFGGSPPYHLFNLPEIISLATGMELDSDRLMEISRRNRQLVRALNIRRGLRRAEEKPPEDHWKIRDHEMEQKHLDAYYEFKGWTRDGIPTKETLDGLGLGYVSDDFVNRGILPDCDSVPVRKAGESR